MLLQRVDVSKHVWTVVAVKRRHVGELQQRESRRGRRRRRRAHAAPAGAVGLSHVFVEVVERGQRLQAELTGVALLRFVGVDGLQMDLQHRQAVEVSLGAVGAGVRDLTPVTPSTWGRKTATLQNNSSEKKQLLPLISSTSTVMTQADGELLPAVRASPPAPLAALAGF